MTFLTGIKWKLYGLIALAFVLGLLQWRNSFAQRLLDAEEAKRLKAQLKQSEEMRDAANSVDTDRASLSDRLRDHDF
jgi:hypothetical protein